MSVVVGIGDGTHVYMASDSYLSDDTSGVAIRGKLFQMGDIGVGVVGSLRHAQIIQYSGFNSIAAPALGKEEAWMCTEVIEELERIIDRGDEGLDVMFGYRGRIWVVQSDLAVYSPVEGYAAIGSGHEVAMGVLYANDHNEDAYSSPIDAVKDAVSAATYHVPTCSRPIHTVVV